MPQAIGTLAIGPNDPIPPALQTFMDKCNAELGPNGFNIVEITNNLEMLWTITGRNDLVLGLTGHTTVKVMKMLGLKQHHARIHELVLELRQIGEQMARNEADGKCPLCGDGPCLSEGKDVHDKPSGCGEYGPN